MTTSRFRREESGQALVEAVVGFTLISAIVVSIFGYLFLSWTHFLIESANDNLNICTVETRSPPYCENQARKYLKRVAPWLLQIETSSRYRIGTSGYLSCDSKITTQFLLEGQWNSRYTSRRLYCEKTNKGSSSPGLCS